MKILCAGDKFISPALLGQEFREAVGVNAGPDVEVVEYRTSWPDKPFSSHDGVREASGDPADLAALTDGIQAILTHLAPITGQVLQAAQQLRVVGVTRGGPVNVDLAAATDLGVPVIYLPGRNLTAVAEYAIGLLISLPRSVVRSSRSLAGGEWDARYFRHDLTGPELGASTLGVIGLGAVGRRVAQLAAGFGTRILAYDPYADPQTLPDGVELLGWEDVLAAADFVSLHARLTDETRQMFGPAAFAAMKPGAYFVNTARGELVDQPALLAALESGHLAGAALDVFDPEPPEPQDPLLRRADVVVTPHLAGASRQVAESSARRVAAEVADFLATGALSHCANPEWSTHRPARS